MKWSSRSCGRCAEQIPSYQAVGRQQIVASVHRILGECADAAGGGGASSGRVLGGQRATVERLGAGVLIEDIMAGFRVTIASIQGRLVELAVECGVDGADVVALTSLLWKLSDAFSARAAADYHRQGMALAMADQRRRDEWLTGALTGDLDSAQLERGYTVYRGLRRDTTYHALLHRPGRRAEDRTGSACTRRAPRARVLMAPTRDRLVGIMENLPTPVPGQLIALGSPAPVDRLATSDPSKRQGCPGRRPAAVPRGRAHPGDLGLAAPCRRLVSWVSCYGCATSSHFTARVLSASPRVR